MVATALRVSLLAGIVVAAFAGGWSADEVMLLQNEIVVEYEARTKAPLMIGGDEAGDNESCPFSAQGGGPCGAGGKHKSGARRVALDSSVQEVTTGARSAQHSTKGTTTFGYFIDLLIVLVVCDGLRRWLQDGTTACGEVLSEKEAAVGGTDAWGCTALHAAAKSGSVSEVDRLVQEELCEVDARDAWEETPLHLAARSGHTDVCEHLIGRGADVHMVNARGWTSLVVAAHEGKESVCQALLARGAGVAALPTGDIPAMLVEMLNAQRQQEFQVMEQAAIEAAEEETCKAFNTAYD